MLQFQDPFAALLAAESAKSAGARLGFQFVQSKEINPGMKFKNQLNLQQAKESRP
jgi:hypothetical protein